MGKTMQLKIKAQLENVEELKTNHPDFSFSLKLKCSGCGEISDKWHDVTESERFPGKTGRSENNYIAKCKMCGRENSLDIIPGSNAPYSNNDSGKLKAIVSFDCRGIEPIEFQPGDGWIIKIEESGKIFRDVDLSEKEWVEYDEKIQQSVGIYEFYSELH
ncbi:UPF0587 protein GA18326 [Rhynchophorus ferrugineus]|uniref:Uncharacterized protein n=1 Tax=Rhynchophorus ferrugineus TaxID=354439 RepID=A0A834MFW7_RHYFE|nr:hypothetical protein GWI33_003272 [Rhynchophorus ferrugineus]